MLNLICHLAEMDMHPSGILTIRWVSIVADGICNVAEVIRQNGIDVVFVGTPAGIAALSRRFKLLFGGSSRFGWWAVVFWFSAAAPRAWHHRCIFILGILASLCMWIPGLARSCIFLMAG